MSPIEYIAEGIQKGNWETVCEGYERLTGISLLIPCVPKIENKDRDTLQRIYDIVTLAVKEPEYIPCSNTNNSIKTPKKKNKKTKKTKKTTITNTGEDSSLILDEKQKTVTQKEVGKTQLITNEPDPEEVEKNRIKAERTSKSKTKLKRSVAKTYDVKCNECENIFKSIRPQGEMGQKCPNCLKDKKSRFT